MTISMAIAFAAMLAGAGGQATAAPTTPVPAPPSTSAASEWPGLPMVPVGPIGAWALYSEGTDSCGVVRNYGTAQNPRTLSIQASLNPRYLTVYLVIPAGSSPERSLGSRIDGAAAPAPGSVTWPLYRDYDMRARGQHFDVGSPEWNTLDGLAPTGKLTILGSEEIAIPASDAMEAIAAMDRCQAVKFESFGIDPARFGHGKPAPALHGNPAGWFMTSDYPPEARRAHEQGRVVVVLEVGSDGLVKGCRVAVSVSPSLDTTTCHLALQRGHFAPVRDAAGNPATTWAIVPVRWHAD